MVSHQHFERVDLLEQDKHFLEKAVEYLDGNSRVGSLYCSGLQNFDFVPETYDVIWCQWVLGHLTDEHLEAFFVRCIKVISFARQCLVISSHEISDNIIFL